MDKLQPIVSWLDQFFKSGPKIQHGVAKVVANVEQMAEAVQTMADREDGLMHLIELNANKTARQFPKIAVNVNKSLLSLQTALTCTCYIFVLLLIVCCCCCLIQWFLAYKQVYGVKKIECVNFQKLPQETSPQEV